LWKLNSDRNPGTVDGQLSEDDHCRRADQDGGSKRHGSGSRLHSSKDFDLSKAFYSALGFKKLLDSVKERLAALGLDPVLNTPDEFAAEIKTEMARWAKVIQDAGIPKIE
jgi:hypothetical protein